MDENFNSNQEQGEVDNLVVLSDENGNDVKFEFLDLIEYEDNQYVVLLPTDEDSDEDGSVVILKLESSAEGAEDEETYVSVDDDNVLNNVFNIFKEKFKDEFDFED